MGLDNFNDLELMGLSSYPTWVRQKLNNIVSAINATDSLREKAMSGNLIFKITPATNTDTAINQNKGAGVKQIDTLTPVLVDSAVVTAGNAKVTVKDNIVGSVEVVFALAQNDNQAAVVSKAKTALGLVSVITTNFTIGGASSTITLEKKVEAANDTSFVVSIEPVTCGDELATVISANTTAGVSPYVRLVTITLEDSEGNVHDWFNADVTVTVGEVTAGSGAIATTDLTPALVNGSVTIPITFSGTFAEGVKQVETATVVGSITLSGNASIVVTAAGMTGSPKTIAVPVVGQAQIETATVLGTIDVAGAGNATVIVTAAGMTNSPKSVTVAVANNDTASQVGDKIRTTLGLDADVAAFFDISGANANIILTSKAIAANDATMNISIDNDTSVGLTAAPTSTSTRAGAVADNANAIADKIRTALGLDAAVIALFNVSGATDKVILTKKVYAANDATLNISIDNGTCTGITTAASSSDTTAGVAPDTNTVTVVQQTILGYTVSAKTSVQTTV